MREENSQRMEDSSLSETAREYAREMYERQELFLSLYSQGKTQELRRLFFPSSTTIKRKELRSMGRTKNRRRKKVGQKRDYFRTI